MTEQMGWGRAARRQLPEQENGERRWHFQHGPIDLIIGLRGTEQACEIALENAWFRFESVLPELVKELPQLFQPVVLSPRSSMQSSSVSPVGTYPFSSPIARRMSQACAEILIKEEVFVTPMAAVAGAVAEHLLPVFQVNGVQRVWVNNGGDIAWWANDAATSFRVALAHGPAALRCELLASQAVWGVATSGWQGRSFSFGIADAVTVLADSASVADVAATLIANRVNLEGHPLEAQYVSKAPANSLKDLTDLGDRSVTTQVQPLPLELVNLALDQAFLYARKLIEGGQIRAAVLCLQGEIRASKFSGIKYLSDPTHHRL